MDILISLSNILKDIVKSVDDENAKEEFIVEHMKNVTKNCFIELQFPEGEDWFNVSKPLTETDLQGKIVILDFFTYCCINCLHVIPHLRALEERFSISDGLVVIGVHSAKFENEKNSSNIELALRRYNITHPVINDRNGYMWNKLKISCWPTIVIIGPDQHTLFVLIGEDCREELILYVTSAMKYYRTSISSHLLPVDSHHKIISSNILCFPSKIARHENILAVSDSGNHRILITNESGSIKFKVGNGTPGFRDGSFEVAQFNSPQGIAFYNENEIYVADTENHAIRLINLCHHKVETVVGTGVQGTDHTGGKPGKEQEISSPWDVCFVPSIHVKHSTGIKILTNESQRLNSSPCLSNAPLLPPPPLPPPFPFEGNTPMPLFRAPPPPPPPQSAVSKENIETKADDIVINDVLIIAMSGIHQIWAFFLQDTVWWKGRKYKKNICTAIAGSGKEENRNNRYPMMASFAQPSGLTYSQKEKSIFIADSESSSIRRLSLEDGAVSHVVGGDRNPINLFDFGDIDGRGFNAKLQHPLGLTFDQKRNCLYLCDTYNNKLKRIDLTTYDCVSLHKQSDLLNEPGGCCLDEEKNLLFIADTNNNAIVLFDLNKNASENLLLRDVGAEESNDSCVLEADISNEGGKISLVLDLGPPDIHGSWKVESVSPLVTCPKIKGEVSSTPQELVLTVLSSDLQNIDVVKILFNLSFCEADTCRFKKYFLHLKIKRVLNGQQTNSVSFRKNF